uniref:Leucine rich repeat and sterile alpha motif containing 1 n=1 Tax=Cynoglossus semilaevis TaxID=244447 RepID=A0A3P8VQN4_CYNSE
MPLFFKKKKPSDDSQKRLEYQLCRSKEAGADDSLDLSCCELSEVPSSAFSICRVLQKKPQVLILHTNELRSLLPKGNDISNLDTLKVLDLHENKLTSLPEDIGKLTSLQILNVDKNRLKSLPDSIGNLELLQTLNQLNELPSSVGSLKSLRTLDLSDNHILQLPKTLAYIRTLESLTLDTAVMTYPPVSVCTEGTESIQRFLCSLGEEYCPPSQYLLPVLESDCSRQNCDHLDGVEETWKNKFSDYEKRKEQKQKEKIAFERHLEERQKEHTQLVLMSSSFKENILNSEQERLEQGVCQQQRAQEVERLLVLEKVRQAEDSISSRISNMLIDNQQNKNTEFLQAMEEEIRMEHLTAITQEETDLLRKREVAAMQQMLSHSCAVNVLQEANDNRRRSLMSEACRMETLDKKFDKMLSLQALDKSKAIAQILQEEEIQKAAFQALQLQKDAVHGYLRNQIKLIENELMLLTKLEVKKRNLDAETLQEVLVDQRTALSDLLQQLLKQKNQREQELQQILSELQRKSESSQENYWMIQYQRLLDAKPMSLRMQQEAGVEKELVNLLYKLSAQHYLPLVAHHRITAEVLRQMSSADLKKIGINGVGIQKALLTYFPSPPPTPGTPVTPAASSPVEAPGSSECVVCMESQSQVIFLPCGHVCCCTVCNEALQNCPMCRANISQRVLLYRS